MGDILNFPASAPEVDQRKGAFFDYGNWKVSRKGNRYTYWGEFCVVTFPSFGGWKWSRTRSAIEGPVYSRQVYFSEHEARRAAWLALAALMRELA